MSIATPPEWDASTSQVTHGILSGFPQGRRQDFSKGGGGGHTVSNRYRHGVFATEYCRFVA